MFLFGTGHVEKGLLNVGKTIDKWTEQTTRPKRCNYTITNDHQIDTLNQQGGQLHAHAGRGRIETENRICCFFKRKKIQCSATLWTYNVAIP